MVGEGVAELVPEMICCAGSGLLRFSGEAPGLSGTGARGGGRRLASGEEERDDEKGGADGDMGEILRGELLAEL